MRSSSLASETSRQHSDRLSPRCHCTCSDHRTSEAPAVVHACDTGNPIISPHIDFGSLISPLRGSPAGNEKLQHARPAPQLVYAPRAARPSPQQHRGHPLYYTQPAPYLAIIMHSGPRWRIRIGLVVRRNSFCVQGPEVHKCVSHCGPKVDRIALGRFQATRASDLLAPTH